jgi:hypothetical protein
MEFDFLGLFKIAKLHASGKVDLSKNIETFSMLKLAQVGEKSTEEDLTKLDEERGVYSVEIDEISINSTVEKQLNIT